MKALSLSRPWPFAIVELGKGIENRSVKGGRMPPMCHYRGELLLHAAKSWDKSAARWMQYRGLATVAGGTAGMARDGKRIIVDDPHHHPSGVVFARCRVVAHITPRPCPECQLRANAFIREATECDLCGGRGVLPSTHVMLDDHAALAADPRTSDMRWWMGGYAIVLADVRPTPLVACKGALGIWTVPDEVAERVMMNPGAAAPSHAGSRP
jgi:hypothetical protein